MQDFSGKTFPIAYSDLDSDMQNNFFGAMGEAAIELIDVANALEKQNADWFKGCQNLATYYRSLSQNLIAAQQLIFGSNVTGSAEVSFYKEG